MEQESRYNGIVDAEGMGGGHHGHHCHHGHHHNLWEDVCEDPRVLMYIDDKNCSENDAVMGAQGRDGKAGEQQAQADAKREETENVTQYQGWQQGGAGNAAQYQGWQQGNVEAAAQYQGWQQENAQNAAQYQGWQQGNTQNAAQYQGWQQGNAEYAAQTQGITGGSACGQVRPGTQFHVHEVQGSVEIAEPQTDPHNHRFATVSGEAKPLGNNNHYHDVRFRTDNYEDHFHEGWGRTGGAIQVGDRHVHFLESVTTQNDGHLHRYRVATMIDDPAGD